MCQVLYQLNCPRSPPNPGPLPAEQTLGPLAASSAPLCVLEKQREHFLLAVGRQRFPRGVLVARGEFLHRLHKTAAKADLSHFQ